MVFRPRIDTCARLVHIYIYKYILVKVILLFNKYFANNKEYIYVCFISLLLKKYI